MYMELFENALPYEEVFYGKSLVKNNIMKDMKMLLYKPTKKCFKKQPLIIMIHGGGFSAGQPEKIEDIVKYYIDRGFLVASPSYRLTTDGGYVPKKWNDMSDKLHNPPPTGEEIRLSEYITSDVSKTTYRATRDIKAAIRWLTKNSSTYNIDIDNVFLYGESAGSLIALTAFLSPENSFFKDDDDVITNDSTLKTTNMDIKPFTIKSAILLSTSDQVLERLKNTYVPDLWDNKNNYKNIMIIHGEQDQIILDKFPRKLYERYNMHKLNNMIKYLNVPNEGHVPFNAIVNNMSVNEHMLHHMLLLMGVDNISCDDLKIIYNKKNDTVYKPPFKSQCPKCMICPEHTNKNNYILYLVIAIVALIIGFLLGKFI